LLENRSSLVAIVLTHLIGTRRLWADLHDLHAGTVEDTKGLATKVERNIAKGQAELAKAAELRDAARAARELDRGEDVVSWLGKRMTSRDLVKIMKDAGWKPADFRNAARLDEIHRLGGSDELVTEIMRRHRVSELAASRAVLRRWRRSSSLPI
jgi:hypothetical protein